MAVSVTLSTIIKEPAPSTRCLVNFSDGAQLEFNSLSDAKAFVGNIETPENARLLIVGRWLAQHPDGGGTSSIEGRTLTIDMAAVNPISVSAAPLP